MCLLSICVLSSVVFTCRADKLSSDILDFDTLDYDTSHIHYQHRRAIRIRSPQVHKVELKFQAFERHFHIRLKPDTKVLSEEFVFVSSDGTKSGDVSDQVYFYEGDLAGAPGSRVHGSLRDGVFQGRISHPGEGYSVEPSGRYFDNATTNFHSVIYKDSHVVVPESFDGGCGLTREMEEMMSRRLEEAEPKHEEKKFDTEHWTHRYKRQASTAQQTCDLHIIIDHFFYNRYHGDKNEILRQIGEHVQGANEIFQQAGFEPYRDLNLAISKLTVYGADERGIPADRTNPFSSENIGVERYLDITWDIAAKDKQRGEVFCLVFAFTNRQFNDGVLGLAWRAESGRSGGFCSSYYNAGVVTANHFGLNVAPLISMLSFAHELGHSFGSWHDDEDRDSTCLPGGSAGNYLMYALSSAGDRPNNDRFSHCSIRNISTILAALGTSERENCLKLASEVSLCGNQIVDIGEECDCGRNNECDDMCCTDTCQLAVTAECSPQLGPCCSRECSFAPTTLICAEMTECANTSFCNGSEATCPAPHARRESELCDGGRKTCDSGSCSRSICESEGQQECQCSEKADRCSLCCQDGDEPGTCTPYSPSSQDDPLMLHVGSPCEDFVGYCDILLQCQIASDDGPLATILRTFIPDFDGGPTEEQLSEAVLDFFVEYWWVAVIAFLVLIGIMALIMFLCNYFTPTDNPQKREAMKARRSRVSLSLWAQRDPASHDLTTLPSGDDQITAI